MAIKLRCCWCDELMVYDPDTDRYACLCGTEIRLPAGQAQGDPYAGWNQCYQSDLKRKKPDANTGSRGRKRKPAPKAPARFNSDYGEC